MTLVCIPEMSFCCTKTPVQHVPCITFIMLLCMTFPHEGPLITLFQQEYSSNDRVLDQFCACFADG